MFQVVVYKYNLYPSFDHDASIAQYYILTELNLSKLGTRTKHFQVTGCFYVDFLQINDHLILKKKTIIFIYLTTAMVL